MERKREREEMGTQSWMMIWMTTFTKPRYQNASWKIPNKAGSEQHSLLYRCHHSHSHRNNTHTPPCSLPVSMDAVYKPHMPVNLSYHLFRHFLVLLSIKSFSFLALLDRVH
jgi:hypothetical protein